MRWHFYPPSGKPGEEVEEAQRVLEAVMRRYPKTGGVFLVPTYLFLGCMFAMGVVKTLLSGGHPSPVVAPPVFREGASGTVSLWLLLKVFSSGCTAMTGVEAVSNGVKAFREPAAQTAQRTLTIIIACPTIPRFPVCLTARTGKRCLYYHRTTHST